MIVMPTH